MADKKKKSKHKGDKQKLHKMKAVEAPIAVDVAPSRTITSERRHQPGEAVVSNSTDNALLDAVIACVEEFGVAGLTTRRIAVLAGVNEVTIFRRFGNKEGLLQAVFVREAQTMRAAATEYTGDLVADLTHMVNAFIDATERRKGVLPMILHAARADDAARAAAQHSLSAFGSVAQVLARYMEEGSLRDEPPERALAALIGPIVFVALVQPIAQTGFPPLDSAAYIKNFLLGRGTDAKHTSRK